MKFDEYGYPRPNGASDSEDSSHLAGILAITEHEQAVDCRMYISQRKAPRLVYQRCHKSKYNFSRDQAWLLMTGMMKQRKTMTPPDHELDYVVDTNLIDGKDLIYPSLKGVEKIAKRGKPYFWQRWWAIAEVWIHAKFQPLEEPFQTIAACEAYGLYKFWTDRNKLWRWSIRRYLCDLDGAWRNELELAEHVIKYIESKL